MQVLYVSAVALCLFVATQGMVVSKMEMTNAKMNKPLSSMEAPSTEHIRSKRTTCGDASLLTSSETTESLVAHNNFRRMETEAADMTEMVYRDDIAARAQEHANQCVWEHDLTSMCDGEGLGQNMYISMGWNGYPNLNVTSAIEGWYNEKSDYDFDTTACAAGKMCGHYTQVVWARSMAVGCAAARCPSVNVGGGTWNNALMVVCNYAAAGNYYGQQPYVKGASCSQCENAMGTGVGNKCVNGLCVQCTPANDVECGCGAVSACNNHGTYNTGTCGCDCDSGYYGSECQNACACEDLPGYETACPQWTVYCSNTYYQAFMFSTCKKTCGQCSTPAGTCGN